MSLVKRQPVHGLIQLIQWCNGTIVKCFFHAGKSILDQQEILDMASLKSPACQLLFTGLYSTYHNPREYMR